MAEKESHRIRNRIIVTVGSGLILSAILYFIGVVPKIISWICAKITWAWVAFIASYSNPGWLLVILYIFAFIGIVSAYRFLRPKKDPKFIKYTEDFLYEAKWRWSWDGQTISKLKGYCPRCDMELVYDDSSCRNRNPMYREYKTDFSCENCNKVVAKVNGGDLEYALSAVKRELTRRIRTNEYIKEARHCPGITTAAAGDTSPAPHYFTTGSL